MNLHDCRTLPRRYEPLWVPRWTDSQIKLPSYISIASTEADRRYKGGSNQALLVSNNQGHSSHSDGSRIYKKDQVSIALLGGELKLSLCKVTDRPLQTASRYCIFVECHILRADKKQRTLHFTVVMLDTTVSTWFALIGTQHAKHTVIC
jgi:hypothetical protein